MKLNPTQITLVRHAVAAKVAYWDALRELEKATAAEGDTWLNHQNDRVIEVIDDIAACAGDTVLESDCVSDDDIQLHMENVL